MPYGATKSRNRRARMSNMAEVSPRIVRRVQADFGTSADLVVAQLERVSLIGRVDNERVLAAILLRAKGDPRALAGEFALAELDWRDTLMYTGLEHAGWEEMLDDEFGPANESA